MKDIFLIFWCNDNLFPNGHVNIPCTHRHMKIILLMQAGKILQKIWILKFSCHCTFIMLLLWKETLWNNIYFMKLYNLLYETLCYEKKL